MASARLDFAGTAEAASDNLSALTAAVATVQRASKDLSGSSGDAVRGANTEATRLLRDLDRAITTLTAAARHAAPVERREMLSQVEQLKSDIAKQRTALQQANDAVNRSTLLAGSRPGKEGGDGERDRMVRTTEKAVRGTAKLHEAQAALAATEDTGIAVIDTLQQQREQILRTTDKAGDVNSLTDKARSIVIGIQRRAITNKFILFGAVIILLAMIGVVVYFGYIKSPKS